MHDTLQHFSAGPQKTRARVLEGHHTANTNIFQKFDLILQFL